MAGLILLCNECRKRLPSTGTRPYPRTRRRADLRRGGDRLPIRSRRMPGVLRGHAGPDHVGENPGRRISREAPLPDARTSSSYLENRDDDHWLRFGRIYHPGTFNANPLSSSAGVATLEHRPRPVDPEAGDGDCRRSYEPGSTASSNRAVSMAAPAARCPSSR